MIARFLAGLRNALRGLALMRHPEVRRYLGERRLELIRLDKVRQTFPAAKIALDVELAGYETGRLHLGEGACLCRGVVLSFGDPAGGHGEVRIGDSTWIGQYNNLRACEGGDVVVGSNCLVSQFCTLVASNHGTKRSDLIQSQPPDPSRLGVTIEDDVWLGAGVSVMPGVVISTGAVVGANSVVTKSVPTYEIWAGVPAQRIGERR